MSRVEIFGVRVLSCPSYGCFPEPGEQDVGFGMDMVNEIVSEFGDPGIKRPPCGAAIGRHFKVMGQVSDFFKIGSMLLMFGHHCRDRRMQRHGASELGRAS